MRSDEDCERLWSLARMWKARADALRTSLDTYSPRDVGALVVDLSRSAAPYPLNAPWTDSRNLGQYTLEEYLDLPDTPAERMPK